MIPKIIVATETVADANWNKHLPVPLTLDEKVIVEKDQEKIEEGYVKVKHGKKDEKVVSVFSLSDFTDLKGNKIKA